MVYKGPNRCNQCCHLPVVQKDWQDAETDKIEIKIIKWHNWCEQTEIHNNIGGEKVSYTHHFPSGKVLHRHPQAYKIIKPKSVKTHAIGDNLLKKSLSNHFPLYRIKTNHIFIFSINSFLLHIINNLSLLFFTDNKIKKLLITVKSSILYKLDFERLDIWKCVTVTFRPYSLEAFIM